MEKKVVFVIAHEGFQATEYRVPKTILEQAGIEVITASDLNTSARAHDGSKVPVDILIQAIHEPDYEAIVFVGGPGALQHLDNDLSYRKIQDFIEADKVAAAICISTRILAKAGALAVKRATGWNGDGKLEEVYKDHAVIYEPLSVVTDKDVVTAQGPSHAAEFAHAILAMI